ncbi:Potassium efflux system KefA protein / Small-conductance mechanosensitive channel [Liberibacter crescens BT-1]|uniref:Potassium efflux system KefA protein / Small-conductance mechanosensitive channel n=3 Tax=Liberibacter crescens TaxID=1273132 RepID=L0EXS6_LIBCB|nr:mechanosensitive ion channel domain-containing protein [Liberibacter crescens]AGA65176.1 Potassium efflux system KefA protein / Small-conductance mechanosensitive channel [Liberibacter crescens BT-1]
MIVFGSSLAAAFLFLLGISKLFGIHTKQKKMINDPSYIDRLIFALHSTIISSASFSIFLVSFLLFIQELDIITGDLIPITSITFSLIGFIYFCWKLIISILSPSLPQWRLVPISNKGSDWLLIYALILVIVSSFDYYFEMISTKSNSIIALNSFSALITGLTLIAISFLKPISDRKDAPETPGKAWPYIIIIAIRSVSIFLIIATLSGYIGLAHFVSKQIVITSSVLIIMYIGVLAGKSISKEGNFAETRIGRSLINNFHLGQVSIDQIGLAAGLGIDVLAIIISIPLILLSLGFSPDDLQNWIYHLFTEIRIGNIRISLLGILAGIAIFCFGLLITRWAQRWLDKNIMARSQTDIGVRNSVEMGVGYLGYAIAAIIGISAAGINLSSLALVASALSLGIGFGLQTIVSNFVSGLILLIERPFKVGDWIVSGTTEGIVRRISVRATEIETFQHQSIIVPNSQFINISVGNWTHRNTLGRIDISLSTPITPTDPDKVMKIMQEVAVNNPLVLRNPPPIIIFSDIQQNSFLFELRVNVANILSGTKVRNELRVSLVENLRKGKIVPFVIAPDDELTKLRKQAYASFPEVMQNGTSNLIFTDTEQQ